MSFSRRQPEHCTRLGAAWVKVSDQGLARPRLGSNPTMGAPQWVWVLVGIILIIVILKMVGAF